MQRLGTGAKAGAARMQRSSTRRSAEQIKPDPVYEGRLRTDRSAQEAFAKLRRRGVTERDLDGLINEFVVVPRLWNAMRQETVPQERRRRERLARKIRLMAESIERDRDAAKLKLRDLVGCAAVESVSRTENPELSQLLRRLADAWERRGWEPERSFPHDALWRRQALSVFAVRHVFSHLACVIRKRPRQRPITIATRIVSAMLDRSIDADLFVRDPVIEQMWSRKRYHK